MNKRFLLIIAVIAFVTNACQKDYSPYEFEAIVLSDNVNNFIFCNTELCTLKFTKGLDRIKTIARNNNTVVNDSIYAVLNFPNELKKEGLIIRLNLREPKDDEMPGCYNFEMPIMLASPIVFATEAEIK
jgi:hypothetical protein